MLIIIMMISYIYVLMILYSLRLSQHSVLSWSLGREEVAMSPIGNSSMIFLKLSFRREVGFYVLQVYIPLTIIVNTSFISFWLQKGEGGREVTARSYLLGETETRILNRKRDLFLKSCWKNHIPF